MRPAIAVDPCPKCGAGRVMQTVERVHDKELPIRLLLYAITCVICGKTRYTERTLEKREPFQPVPDDSLTAKAEAGIH